MSESLLRQLDPADPPKAGLPDRARADLDRILYTADRPTARTVRRNSQARAGVGVAVAATLAVAGVLAPGALRSGDTAFASWIPAGGHLSASDTEEAGESCREELSEADPAAAHAHTALADRRGDWTTVVLSSDEGFSGLCITDASAGWFRADMVGSAGVATRLAPVGERGVVATDLGTGTMTAGDISLAAGVVGPEVAEITTYTESHGAVAATIADGRFALWFPGDEFDGRAPVTVEVSYVDGSTATVKLEL